MSNSGEFEITTYRRYVGEGASCLALIYTTTIGPDGDPWRTQFGEPFPGHSHPDVWGKANDWLILTGMRPDQTASDLDQINKGEVVLG